MKYKVGDIVTIKTWGDMSNQYGLDVDASINVPYGFTTGMKSLCGTLSRITKKNGTCYTLEGCSFENLSFSEEMFEDSLETVIRNLRQEINERV